MVYNNLLMWLYFGPKCLFVNIFFYFYKREGLTFRQECATKVA